MDYILIAKMGISCKFHTDSEWMKSYMLIYIIHMKCDDVMANH